MLYLKRLTYSLVDKLFHAILAGKSGAAAEARALAWGYRRQAPPHIMTTRNGVKMHFDRPDFIPLLLDYLGSFEPHCLAVADLVIRRAAAGNLLVLDVGGNIGAHALQFARTLGPQGKVVTIEAMPFHADTIRRNLALNSLPMADVDVRNVAVGAQPGSLTLGLPAGGNEGCYSAGVKIEGGADCTVPMTTIDMIMEDFPNHSIVMMKMDIEGSEVSALAGAVRTIEKHKPPVLIEINEAALSTCGASSVELKGFFEQRDYVGYLVARDREGRAVLSSIPDERQHITDEVLFIHKNEIDAFDELLHQQSFITVT